MIGRVVSTKMEKTVVVLVASRKKHPLYKKTYAWSKKYLADDQLGVSLGDVVEIVKVKPISKRKHFQVTKVVGSDFVAIAEEHLKEDAKDAIEEVLPEEKEEETEVTNVTEETNVEKVEKEEKPKKAKAKKETK